MKLMYQKRENCIHDFFDKNTRYLINHCIQHNIGRIIIGYNPGWKQYVKIAKRNTQNSVNIPFLRLIKLILYKASLVGIQVDIVEESYTSQICYRCGRCRKTNRKYRGLYVCDECDLVINSDVNRAINIVHKLEAETFKDYYAMNTLFRPISIKF